MKNKKKNRQDVSGWQVALISPQQQQLLKFLSKNADDIYYSLKTVQKKIEKAVPDWKKQADPECMYWHRELSSLFFELNEEYTKTNMRKRIV